MNNTQFNRYLYGGDFLQGAANGLMVGGLNQLKHQVETAQNEKSFQRTLEKWNEYVKQANDGVSLPVDLANLFTRNEIRLLRKGGYFTQWVGRAVYSVDAGLTIAAMANGQPWGGHAYDATLGFVGTEGGALGAFVATGVDSYVQSATFLGETTHWINTAGQKILMNQVLMAY